MIASTELGAKLIDILRNVKTINENSVIEFKVEPHSKEHDCELVKDILGLANSYERPTEDRWLIYGVNIKDRVLIGVDVNNPNLLDDANYQQKLDKITPDIHIEFLTVPAPKVEEGFDSEKVFAAFYIPSNCMSCIHECGKPITDKEPDKTGKHRCINPGTSFVRIGSSTVHLLEFHREKIRAAANAKVERPHQFEGFHLSKGGYTRAEDALLLLGSWDESSESDKKLIGELCGDAYYDVIKGIHPMLDNGVFKMRGSRWTIQDRLDGVARVGQHLTRDALLDLANPIGKIIFSVDESYRLPEADRGLAALRGVSTGASRAIRKSAASLCAIVGNHPELLPQCRQEDIERFIASVLRVGFESDDWHALASSDEDMPLLAEASPSIFLSFVEEGLKRDAIKDLLQEKSGGTISFGLGSGLIHGIRIAALSKNMLSRVIPILVQISNYTDIGNSAIVDLLLPWYPSTPASVECRMGASSFLARCKETAAWDALIALLPDNTTASIGVVEPEYMVRPDLPESVSLDEYWRLSREYCAQALCGASGDIVRMKDIVANMTSFKRAGMIDEACSFLKEECAILASDDKYVLWSKLLSYIDRCKKFSGADWTPKGEDLQKLEELALAVKPESEFYVALRYCSTNDWDIFNDDESISDGMTRVRSMRAKHLERLYSERGISIIKDLLDGGALGYALGGAMALLPVANFDQLEIISLLESESSASEQQKFAQAYIGAMYADNGQAWIDSLPIDSWGNYRKAKFFSCLPLTREVWEQAESALGDDSVKYWQEAPYYCPFDNNRNVSFCAKRFIDAGRANVSVDLLSMALQEKISVEPALIRKSLWKVEASQIDTMLSYHIERLLEYLGSVDPNDELFALELQYAAVLQDGYNSYMHRRMAYDPEAFLTIVSLAFDLGIVDEGELGLSSETRIKIMYRRLQEWRVAPGTNEAGEFDEDAFRAWTDAVNDRLGDDRSQIVVSHQIGRACFYAPSHDAFFIPRIVAEYLDSNEEALHGFEMECFNSRGVYWVDETGAEEDAIADDYEKKAEAAEAHGYFRLASSLRRTVKSYRREAERNRDG